MPQRLAVPAVSVAPRILREDASGSELLGRQGRSPSENVLAWRGSTLEGFASAHRGQVLLFGERVPAARIASRSLSVLVHPTDGARLLYTTLMDHMAATGVAIVYGLVSEADLPSCRSSGLLPLFPVQVRNLYLGLDAVSSKLSVRALGPVRRLARSLRHFRPNLVEAAIDSSTLSHVVRLHQEAAAGAALAVDKTSEWLAERYDRPGCGYRFLGYKKRPGQGYDGFAIVHSATTRAGRRVVHLLDVGVRESRATLLELLRELVFWGLAEDVDVIRVMSIPSSPQDLAFLAVGALRKRSEQWLVAGATRAHDAHVPASIPPRLVRLTLGDLDIAGDLDVAGDLEDHSKE